jgi:hypothetical protein
LPIILAKNPIWMSCQSCLDSGYARACIDSCNVEMEPAINETETHRRVVLQGGGPRTRGDYAASVHAAGNGVRRRRARPAKGDDGVPRRGRDGGSPAAGTTAAVRTCSARRPCRPARCCCSRPAGGCGSAHSAARRPSRRRRRDRPQRAVLRVVGVVRLVLQLRRSGTLVLAHLVEVDGVPGIVAAPGAVGRFCTSRNEQYSDEHAD